MVIFAMSRVAGCSMNRRALTRPPHRPAQHSASPFLSVAYKSAYTHESHLTVIFSCASGYFFGYQGGGGYALPTPSRRHLLTRLLPATYTHPSLRTRHRVPNDLWSP